MTDSELLFWLSRSGLSVKKQIELIRIADGLPQLQRTFDSNPVIKEFLKDKYEHMKRMLESEALKDILCRLSQDGIGVITRLNPLFPESLAQTEVNAPLAMYYRGNLQLLNTPCIAVVGTRAVTRYGKAMTEKFVEGLVKGGFTIVSGLATGVDGIAHQAALACGGNTIAVLGSGINVVTPAAHAKLYDEILQKGGLILSEYKPNDNATKYTFPERNRLISGLCKGVLVVEAGEKSGALHTADFALEQGRDVFAVPGNLDSSRSKGTNNLLYNGAQFVRCGEDICSFYGIEIAKKERNDRKLDEKSNILYQLILDGEKSIDELIEQSQLSPSEVFPILIQLELDGWIARSGNDSYIIAEN